MSKNEKADADLSLVILAPAWKPSQPGTTPAPMSEKDKPAYRSRTASASGLPMPYTTPSVASADRLSPEHCGTRQGIHGRAKRRPAHRKPDRQSRQKMRGHICCKGHQSSPRTIVKKSTFVALLLAALHGFRLGALFNRAQKLAFDVLAVVVGLPKRMHNRAEFGRRLVCPKAIAVANHAGFSLRWMRGKQWPRPD